MGWVLYMRLVRHLQIFFFYFLIVSSLFGASIDHNWFDVNSSELETKYLNQSKNVLELLQQTTISTEEKEELEYQNLLLQKLLEQIKLDTVLQIKTVNDINSTVDFIKSLKEHSEVKELYFKKNYDSNENHKKIQTIEDQIEKATQQDTTSFLNTQLLYAYYMIKTKKMDKNLQKIQKVVDANRKIFLNALTDKLLQAIPDSEIKLAKQKELLRQYLNNERITLLAYDKAEILQNAKALKNIDAEILKITALKTSTIEKIMWLKVELMLPLLQNKNKGYFDAFKEFQVFLQNNNLNDSFLIEFFKYLSREYMGLTQTALADTKSSFLDMISYFWKEITNPFIPIGKGLSILSIVQFLMIFVIGFAMASFYRHKIILAKDFFKNSSSSTKTMLSNLGYYFLVFVTFLIALDSVGLDLSSLTILAGALSVGLGFGLQNIVSNFISGIILIFEKTIQVGNIIEVAAGVKGKVTQINMRSSIVKTFDNVEFIIPNSTFIQNNIINLTLTDDIRRIQIPFSIAYGSDVEKVIKIILEDIDRSNLVYMKNEDDKEKLPKVWMNAMGTNSLDMMFLVWIHVNPTRDGIESSTLSEFLIFIYKTLQANNIEIPFPQLDINIKSNNSCSIINDGVL